MILTTLLMSLFCVAIYEMQSEGMILHPIRRVFNSWRRHIDITGSKLQRSLYTFLSKPISTCIICYASVWGTVAYWLLDAPWTREYIFCIVIAAPLNYVIFTLYKDLTE